MLKYNIKLICTNRQIKYPVSFLTKAGFRAQTASRIVNNKFVSLSPALIEKLCLALHCTPNDLMQWSPDPKTGSNNHPLQSLIRDEENLQLLNLTENIPIDKLKEFYTKAAELKDNIINK